jgi:hypothetical protein
VTGFVAEIKGMKATIDLSKLDRQIRERLEAAKRRYNQRQEVLKREIAAGVERSRRFARIADHLVQTIICPRVARLASFFENAELSGAAGVNRYHCVCQFRHTEQFPASTKLTLGVSHDARFEHLRVLYELEMLPLAFHVDGQSELSFPLGAVDEAGVAAWVEERIIAFVDTYLRLGNNAGSRLEVSLCDPAAALAFRPRRRPTVPCGAAAASS